MTCSTCTTLNGWLAESDRIIPHDILGGILIAGIALAAIFMGLKGDYLLAALILIALIGAGVAVDLAAHGWTH